MTTSELTYVHRFVPAKDETRPPLLLLHGTGGDENDLLPLGAALDPGAALLSLRGDVLEHGMPRFFRRHAEGVFDEADVRRAAEKLADFVSRARKTYGIAAPIAVGYSNGANVAAAALLLRPETFSGAVLLRAMRPFADPVPATIPATPVLILSGALDPIVPAGNAEGLAAMLQAAGAKVTHQVVPASHALTEADLTHARTFLTTH